jgi:hypothetical protein
VQARLVAERRAMCRYSGPKIPRQMASDVHRMQAKSEASEFPAPGVLVDPPRYDERAWAREGTKV